LTTSGVARINLFLHGIEDFQIVRGDTLRQPAFFDGDRLATFDCVIANPPFSLKHWGEDLWANDPYGRNIAGIPPGNYGDYAWVQHMLCSMAPKTGRMAVVLPHGAIFRMGVEGEIRHKILEMDMLEAVIGLGPNLFYGTGLAGCILVFQTQKQEERKGRVLIIDASKLFKKGRNQNTLTPEHINQIFNLYKAYRDEKGAARVVSLKEIASNSWNLNISRYVESIAKEETSNVSEAIANLKLALEEAYAVEDRLKDIMLKAGLASENLQGFMNEKIGEKACHLQ
jgi:type I restriction enzyme M protein